MRKIAEIREGHAWIARTSEFRPGKVGVLGAARAGVSLRSPPSGGHHAEFAADDPEVVADLTSIIQASTDLFGAAAA